MIDDDPSGSSSEAIPEPYWHVHAQCNAAWEAEHRPTFVEAIAAGHTVVDRAADTGTHLPVVIREEAHRCLARLSEEAIEGSWYHYEWHPWPNLFIWLGKIEAGGDCIHCASQHNRPHLGFFRGMVAAGRFLLFEQRKCPPSGPVD